MSSFYNKWLKISIFNLLIVAALGVTLRYKIAFFLPFVDQGNLLHGHSHFAFSGWVTQVLITLLVYNLKSTDEPSQLNKYTWILVANLLVSYGMLISFTLQGYASYSILFSTLAIFVSFIFSFIYWKDLNRLNSNSNSNLWFKAALVFNVLSSMGPFSLAYMRANHILLEKMYMLSIYFFLHFQYNGWFLFACLGLFVSMISKFNNQEGSFKFIFWIFALCCIPAYFLSALWLQIPKVIYLLVVFSAIMQLIAWLWCIRIVRKTIHLIKNEISIQAKWLLGVAAIAMTIKLTLQLGSTYPPLSKLAFGFRPIVIGYIHLVLLGVISMSILGFVLSEKIFVISRRLTWGIIIFVAGVFLNEILLMTQGIFALATKSINYINIFLFIAALVMFTGTVLINFNLSPSADGNKISK